MDLIRVLGDAYPTLIKGLGMTVGITVLSLLLALVIGVITCLFGMSKFKPLKWIASVYIWIIRGTPLMLQLIVVFYGPGLAGAWAEDLLAVTDNAFIQWIATWNGLDRFPSVLVAFVINYACYFSEIYRGGIESIPKGQYEAGQVLGMTKTQIFFKIVLLQVVKRIIPPMSNEIITLVKDTSLARIIAVYEIIWSAQVYIKSAGLIWPLFYTAAFYLIFNGILTVLFRKIEKKLDYFKG